MLAVSEAKARIAMEYTEILSPHFEKMKEIFELAFESMKHFNPVFNSYKNNAKNVDDILAFSTPFVKLVSMCAEHKQPFDTMTINLLDRFEWLVKDYENKHNNRHLLG
ncbi:MAG: hypothetical protein QM743_04715 [Chitinophagaceae bacterium]